MLYPLYCTEQGRLLEIFYNFTFFSACQESGPCQNGGTCTRSGLGYNCKCKLFEKGPLQNFPAFSGTNCETHICKYIRPKFQTQQHAFFPVKVRSGQKMISRPTNDASCFIARKSALKWHNYRMFWSPIIELSKQIIGDQNIR